MKTKFYRIITPSTLANLDFATLEEAKQGLKEFGGDPRNLEYYQYWQEQKSKCKVVKVTQTIEEVTFK